MFIALAAAGAMEQPRRLFPDEGQDRILMCVMHPSEDRDSVTTARLTVLLPVIEEGHSRPISSDILLRTRGVSLLDPSNVMGGLNARMVINAPGLFTIAVGDPDQEFIVLGVDPKVPQGNGFFAVVGSKGSDKWLGSCTPRAGSGVRAEFEAMK
ncbi:hypothetical protein [Sphingomonas sp.]|uniref:hypothetical protein n=1 Tax=Sphingomonas sp. TaxID=28214 RepID=UPI0035BC74A4